MGLGGGRACSVGVKCAFGFFGELLAKGVRAGMLGRTGDEFRGSSPSPMNELLSAVPENSDESELSDSLPSSRISRGVSFSSSLIRCERRWCALAAFRGFTLRLWNVSESISFSDDISLLVMVSLRGRPVVTLVMLCTPSDEPRRRPLSGGREGEVIITETPPSAASLNPLLRAEPRMGEDPARVRTGIFWNLIWFAGLG